MEITSANWRFHRLYLISENWRLHRQSELVMTSANIEELPLVESYFHNDKYLCFIFICVSTFSVIEEKLEKIMYHKKNKIGLENGWRFDFRGPKLF